MDMTFAAVVADLAIRPSRLSLSRFLSYILMYDTSSESEREEVRRSQTRDRLLHTSGIVD